MFNFKFLIKSTTTLCLLSAPLFAMVPEKEDSVPRHGLPSSKNQHTEMEIESSSQVFSLINMPQDITEQILASTNMLPIHLTSICKSWYSILYGKNSPSSDPIKYTDLRPIMKKCMGTWGKERVENMVLAYYAKSLPFSDTPDGHKGTVDLSGIEDAKKISAITTDMERFFKIDEAKDDDALGRVNVLFVSRQAVEDNINSIAYPFADIMSEWNGAYPVAMVWRQNIRKDLNRYDYLINVSLSSIVSKNLFENWEKSKIHGTSTAPVKEGFRARWHGVVEGKYFQIRFRDQN